MQQILRMYVKLQRLTTTLATAILINLGLELDSCPQERISGSCRADDIANTMRSLTKQYRNGTLGTYPLKSHVPDDLGGHAKETFADQLAYPNLPRPGLIWVPLLPKRLNAQSSVAASRMREIGY